jgi:translation initiation factor IF-1
MLTCHGELAQRAYVMLREILVSDADQAIRRVALDLLDQAVAQNSPIANRDRMVEMRVPGGDVVWVSMDTFDSIKDLITRGRKIEAIKILRGTVSIDLKRAKEIVEYHPLFGL